MNIVALKIIYFGSFFNFNFIDDFNKNTARNRILLLYFKFKVSNSCEYFFVSLNSYFTENTLRFPHSDNFLMLFIEILVIFLREPQETVNTTV
jgi:hypothetical protein